MVFTRTYETIANGGATPPTFTCALAAPASNRLVATANEQAVRVAVTDSGEGFTPRSRDPDRLEDGYGLYLLEKAASSWGVESSGGTTVWFELDRAPPAES